MKNSPKVLLLLVGLAAYSSANFFTDQRREFKPEIEFYCPKNFCLIIIRITIANVNCPPILVCPDGYFYAGDDFTTPDNYPPPPHDHHHHNPHHHDSGDISDHVYSLLNGQSV